MGIKLKPTELLQWKVPKEWVPDKETFKKYKSLRPYKDYIFWKMIDEAVYETMQNGALGLFGTQSITYVPKNPPTEPDDKLTWSGLKLISMTSEAIVDITGSPLIVTGGGFLYLDEPPRPLENGSMDLVFGKAEDARKKGNIPLGYVTSSGDVYFRSGLNDTSTIIEPYIDTLRERAEMLVFSNGTGYATNYFTWANIVVVSPRSGGVLTVTGSPLWLLLGESYSLYVTAGLPLATGSAALQKGTPAAANESGNIAIGYFDGTFVYLRSGERVT